MNRLTSRFAATFATLLLCGMALGQATTNPDAQTTPRGQPGVVLRSGPKAAAHSGWWNDAIFYEIFLRSFADSRTGEKAGDGIGDIQGLIERLDYLNDGDPLTTTDLGVTALWLMPVTESPSYHGYDTTDYRTIERDYGSNDDFKRLVAECHKRGIKVIIDLVLNHCSSKHPWFVEAQDPSSPKHDWFIWQKNDPAYRGPWNQKVWQQISGKPALGYFYSVFGPDMPDLNYANQQVSDEMLSTAKFWLTDMGIDGFRLDAIRHLIEDGKQQDSTPATHQWLRTFAKGIIAVKPQAFTVGEVWAPTNVASAYVHSAADRELDTCFEFELAGAIVGAANTGEAAKLAGQLDTTWSEFPDNQFASFLTNHDQTRVMTMLKGDVTKAKLAASLLLTLPGVPFLYYGEEIGMTGDKPDPKLRTPMQWTASTPAATPAGADETTGTPPAGVLSQPFSTSKPWQAVNGDISRVNVERQSAEPSSLLNSYKRLIRLRQAVPALARGGLVLASSTHPSVLAFLRTPGRSDDGSTVPGDAPVLVIANLGAEPVMKYSLTVRGSRLTAGEHSAGEVHADGKPDAAKPLAALTVAADGDLVSITPIPTLRPRTVYVIRVGQ